MPVFRLLPVRIAQAMNRIDASLLQCKGRRRSRGAGRPSWREDTWIVFVCPDESTHGRWLRTEDENGSARERRPDSGVGVCRIGVARLEARRARRAASRIKQSLLQAWKCFEGGFPGSIPPTVFPAISWIAWVRHDRNRVDHAGNLTYYGLVKTIKISEFKKHISEELRRIKNGERVVILDRDNPVAEVIPYEQSSKRLVVRPPRGPRALPAVNTRTKVDPLDYLLEDRARR